MPFSDHPQPFEVRVRRSGNVLTLALYGELDLGGRKALTDSFERAVAESPTTIIVDLHELAFMDSTGLHCLIEAKALVDESGVRLAVVNGTGPAHRILELSGMDEMLEMVEDESQLDPPAGRRAT